MKLTKPLDPAAIKTAFAASGLNLCKIFALQDLAETMPDLPVSHSHLILIGNTDKELWSLMPDRFFGRPDPVDEYSVDCVSQVLGAHASGDDWQVLFPLNVSAALVETETPTSVPLQQLGVLAGWHQASPLGIGINAEHGLWFAYRAVILINAEFSGSDKVAAAVESPCLRCESAPCLSACPAGALRLGENPDLTACVTHRAAEGSSCQSTCLARLACPLGHRYRYSTEQTSYYYQRSLDSVKRWVDRKG